MTQSPNSKIGQPFRHERVADDIKHLSDYLSSPEQKKPPRPKQMIVHQKDLEQ